MHFDRDLSAVRWLVCLNTYLCKEVRGRGHTVLEGTVWTMQPLGEERSVTLYMILGGDIRRLLSLQIRISVHSCTQSLAFLPLGSLLC